MSPSHATEEQRFSSSHEALGRAVRGQLGLVWGALTNIVTTSIAHALLPYAELAHLMIIHLLGAVLISTRYGMAVSTVTAITGALAFDYFCIPPIFAFAMPDPHSVATFAGILAVALLVCWLNQGVRLHSEAASTSEARTQALCELSLDLSHVSSVAELAERAQAHLVKLFGPGTQLLLGAARPARSDLVRQRIGAGEQVYGYVHVPVSIQHASKLTERRLLLTACADRIADAFQRLALGEAANQAKVDADLERNRNALLSAVSHDMKTPLASILTAGTSLLSQAELERGAGAQRELLETIVQEAERMNDLITNLLSVTRLESGASALNKEPEALDDLIFGALSRLSGRLQGRAVTADIPRDLPLVPLDPVLVDQLLVNLLENALRYTPDGTPLDIQVALRKGRVVVDVCDRGPGIPSSERDKVFEKFYRGQAARRNDGGTGLGLTICRAVARAHGGDMAILARDGGGALVRFSLPCSATLAGIPSTEERRLHA
jgi:two-component system sensor histidine kinase KdpD